MLCYLGLGANLGRRARQLAQAIAELAADPALLVRRVSGVYETAPVGYTAAPDYLNLVVALEAACAPLDLLHRALQTEARLGRQRPFVNAPRTIDIDLLVCGDIMMDTGELTLPHPRMWQRQFVLAPLAQLAPGLRVGGRGPVAALVDPADPEVRRLGPLAEAVRGELRAARGA